ncbi:MAG: DNA double-strand break repair nuclease NurA [Candidatus Odinarchaeia archaeon]
MLDLLLQKCLEKKDILINKISSIQKPRIEAQKYWKDIEIKESIKKISIGAVDGSSNRKQLRSMVLYTLGAVLVIYDGEKITTYKTAEVDLLKPYKLIRDRIRFYMTILEHKIALKALETNKIDLILFDGSILGNLIRPMPYLFELKSEVQDLVLEKYYPILASEIEKGENKIVCIDLFDEITTHINSHDQLRAIFLLEYLENLLIIKKLMEYKEKIVGVSKTSDRTDYFGQYNIPDISIFERSCKNQGYSIPRHILTSREVKRKFPTDELDEYFRRLIFTVFYARLENKKNVLKFETPVKLKPSEIENLLAFIKPISTEGYPYLLKKAHNETIIRDKDVRQLIKLLGIVDRTGREML